MKENPQIITVGEEFILTATAISYLFSNGKSDKDIAWEMKCMSPSNATPIEIGTGRSIKYKLNDEYVNKRVLFTAYVKGVQQAWNEMYSKQDVACYVQPKPQKILVRKVEANANSVAVGDEVEFRVTQYSIDMGKVIDSTRNSVKWQFELDGKNHMLLSDTKSLVMSDKINVKVRPEWAGKEITMMPYLNKFTNTVAAKINVKPLDRTKTNDIGRKAFFIHGTVSTPERWEKWKDAVDTLNLIALPDINATDTKFDWATEATQLNNLNDRWEVSERLVKYVMNNARGFEEVVLVGHSHGGNVAILAADKLAKEAWFRNIYVITVGTPVFNKEKFITSEGPNKFQQVEMTTKVTYFSDRYGSYIPQTTYMYTYRNPENPENWQFKDKIKHLSLYNIHDRVDGIAKAGDGIIESSRMTSDTCRFAYNSKVNVEIVSNVSDNEKKRNEYRNHCSHRISALLHLRGIIAHVESPLKINFAPQPSDRLQDNTRVVINSITYEMLGYRKISNLPDFAIFNLQSFLKNGAPTINVKKIKDMRIEDMRIFFGDASFNLFLKRFYSESIVAPQKDYPYPVDGFDFRSPNLKKIDSEVSRLAAEVEGVEAFNAQTKDDRFAPWAKYVGALLHPLYYYPLYYYPIKYFTDGTDNHSFDTNSPELIQQAINDGRIKPFARVKRTQER